MKRPSSIALNFTLLLTGMSAAAAADVKMGVMVSLPPYVIAETNSGFEYDIVKEALALKGHTLTPTYVPLARLVTSFNAGEVDAVMTVTKDVDAKDAHFSDDYVLYQNYAITLASKNLTIEKVADLADKSVVSFQNAKIYLGPEYADMAESNRRYEERPNLEAVNKLLYTGRIEAVVIDGNIFQHFSSTLGSEFDTSQPVVFHEIFEPSYRQVAFRDAEIRDEFNDGLRMLRESGRYSEIVNSYLP